jgi:dimethylglycine dehydrogenase
VKAEHVVNCGGLWAREVGRMVGLELPVLAMEHHYLITDEMPEVTSRDRELPHCIDFGAEIYMRQEGKGLVMGTYERNCVPWSPKQTPWDFGHELLPPDLDRIAGNLEVAFEHFPALETAGIKQVINGPFTFAPDGNPLVGPVRGLSNFWVACGVMAGFSQGGGVGLALANWIDGGRSGLRRVRHGRGAIRRLRDAGLHQRQGARELRPPLQDHLPERGTAGGPSAAHHGDLRPPEGRERRVRRAYGMEHALWFAPKGAEPMETPTYRRSNAFEPAKAECKAVREAVGMTETAIFAKYEVTGPEAEGWLSHLLTNRMPREGRLVLTPMLNPGGKIVGDFTVAKAGPERFFIFGSGIAEDYHLRWFEQHLPERGVRLQSRSRDMQGFIVAGPNSRALLARLTDTDVSNAAFPFMDFRRMDLGMIPAWVGRINFTGDLGYELWVAPDDLRRLHADLLAAGEDLGLRQFGLRAILSLRLEKSYGTWAREYRPIYTPAEAGLDRFVDLRKNAFIGRDAVLKEKETGPKLKLVTFTVDADGADVVGDEPVWHDGKVIGWVTSGGYAHWADRSVALGYVPAELAAANGGFEIEILGERRRAELQPEPLFDPKRERMLG